jgi:CRP-like cAMP-binding protein
MTDKAPAVAGEPLRAAEVVHAGQVCVSFENGPTVRAKVGDALLDIAEASQVPIESSQKGSFEARVRTGTERQRTVVLERGDLFGEVAFFDGQPRSADVIALEPSEVLILTPAAFERLRVSCPRLALHLTLDLGRILGERLRASEAVAGAW